MKHQYFGDINDYRKYGLIRILAHDFPVTFCWMLTPDDRSGEGGKLDYLHRPGRYRYRDPMLFDHLHDAVAGEGRRSVLVAQSRQLFPTARFFDDPLHDSAEARRRYFNRLWRFAEGTGLIFFDPDNGLEIKSKKYGTRGSSRYLYWREVEQTHAHGYSQLIYQHFPREDRSRFIDRLCADFRERLGVDRVHVFRTAHVVFFLIVQSIHGVLERQAPGVETRWEHQIRWRVDPG